MSKKIGAIILAAGKGSRMKSKDLNKVALTVAEKPLILHVVERLTGLGIDPIVVVVGFAKQSVMSLLDGNVIFAEQKKRLGTAHAALKGFNKIPQDVNNIMLIYGDEFSYPRKKTEELIRKHISANSALTLLTIQQENPYGLGRIIRDNTGKLLKIVEEKDANNEERKITEVNPGCYICTAKFLKKYLPKIKKSPVTGEYYLTDIVDLAIRNKEMVETVYAGDMLWKSINTREELENARQAFSEFFV